MFGNVRNTSFNGQAVTYDEIGNPITFGSKSFEWCGRQLERITDGDNTYVYAYNTDGDRVSKTVNGVKTEYFYNGSILAGQKTGDETLIFMYDNNGDAFGFIYNGEEYYYIKNVQNDIVAIADKNGDIVANYYYDAWGNVTQITGNTALAQTNPLRYRSYYYDSETGFYYVSSRYYNPEICRFISVDGLLATGTGILEHNMFTYCNNNPVNLTDDDGRAPLKVARYLFARWIFGGGKKIILKSNSFVSKSLKKSKTMRAKINETVEKYKNGEEYESGTVIFKHNEPDLWLGVRKADTKMTIKKETKTTGFGSFKKTKTRYVVNVTVLDTYNFNKGDEIGDGIGSWLNNIGYWAQEKNLGKEYEWEANYVYKTKWE